MKAGMAKDTVGRFPEKEQLVPGSDKSKTVVDVRKDTGLYKCWISRISFQSATLIQFIIMKNFISLSLFFRRPFFRRMRPAVRSQILLTDFSMHLH
jgi:hypothetical protein